MPIKSATVEVAVHVFFSFTYHDIQYPCILIMISHISVINQMTTLACGSFGAIDTQMHELSRLMSSIVLYICFWSIVEKGL
jgi:hypothetical protein